MPANEGPRDGDRTADSLAELRSDVRHLRSDVTDLKADLKTEVRVINQRIDALSDKVDKKVDALSNKVDEKLGALSNKVDEKLGALSNKVDEKLGALSNKVDEKTTALLARVEGVAQMVGAAKLWAITLFFSTVASLLLVMARAFKWL